VRVLFVSEVSSIHAARWVNQFKGAGWDLHVFQALARRLGVNRDFDVGTIHVPSTEGLEVSPNVALRSTLAAHSLPARRSDSLLPPKGLQWVHVLCLARLISELQPDVIHSLGMNVMWTNVCTPMLQARQLLGGRFKAPWVYSSWGADLMHFPKGSPGRRRGVEDVLSAVDYYISECERDVGLARELGFRGELLGYLPAFGGVDPDTFGARRQPGPVSARKTLVLKGRDQVDGDPQGRALTALRAIELCSDVLQEYEIVIVHAGPTVRRRAAALEASNGLKIVFPPHMAYVDWLRVMGRSRVMMSVTVTDGLPGTLVEALALGAFPVQSDLESTREWVSHGENGFLVCADDPGGVAECLRQALTDDELVAEAAERNDELVRKRLADAVVRPQAEAMYQRVVRQGPVHGPPHDRTGNTQGIDPAMISSWMSSDLEEWATKLNEREVALNERERSLDERESDLEERESELADVSRGFSHFVAVSARKAARRLLPSRKRD